MDALIVAIASGAWPSISVALATVGALAAAGFLSWKAKSGDAWRDTAEAHKMELELSKEQVARLEQIDQERAVSVLALEQQIEDLKTRDQAAVLTRLDDLAESFGRHETNAQARADQTHDLQEKTLTALERVADAVEQGGTP